MHYDLRLELDGALKSWAIPREPVPDPEVKRLAVMVEDHPLDYASFHGTIPKGEYGAGEVRIWDSGTYTAEVHGQAAIRGRRRSDEVMREGLAAGKVSFVLNGRRLNGSWTLVKTRRVNDKDNWLLIKHRDEAPTFVGVPTAVDAPTAGAAASTGAPAAAGPGVAAATAVLAASEPGVTVPAGAVAAPAGRRAGRAAVRVDDIPEAKRAPFPSFVPPMLATPAGLPEPGRDDDRWLWEPKLDGYRIMALLRDGKARLLSRNAIDVTGRYPGIARELDGQAGTSLVLDGEVVAVDDRGRPSFQALQGLDQAPAAGSPSTVVYYVFDILYCDGYDLRQVPLKRRKEVLKAALTTSEEVRLVEYFTGKAPAIYRSAVDTGFEGIVGKLRDSLYEPGLRSRDWIKIKAVQSDDFIVGGFSPGLGSRSRTFGALLLGQYDRQGRLRYAGNVGTGFDEKMLVELRRRLEATRIAESPFTEEPRPPVASAWVRPEMVVEVKFDQRTKDGYLRIPVFLRVRDDKPAGDARAPAGPEPEPAAKRDKPAPAGRTRRAAKAKAGRPAGAAPRVMKAARAAPALAAARPARRAPAAEAGPAGPDRAVESVLDQLTSSRDAFTLEVDGEHVSLTNLSKVLWPSAERPVTKRDLLVYLARASPHLLRHAQDRPLSLTRYPDGVDGPHFYQKHWPVRLPRFVATVQLNSKSEGWQQYLLCQNLPTLLWLGQMANLEFHVWFSRVAQEPDSRDIPRFRGPAGEAADYYSGFPDFVIFDLDPYIYSGAEAKGAEPELNRQAYAMTCQVARWLKDLLDGLSLESFVKTSGRTGLHVYVPVRRRFGFDTVRQAAAIVAARLLRDHPRDITLEWAVKRRTGKVFVDYNQNVQGKTLACAYSPRPSPGGTVSLPLPWEDIEKVYPTDFTVFTAPERMARAGDAWQDILGSKRDLKALLERGPAHGSQ